MTEEKMHLRKITQLGQQKVSDKQQYIQGNHMNDRREFDRMFMKLPAVARLMPWSNCRIFGGILVCAL